MERVPIILRPANRTVSGIGTTLPLRKKWGMVLANIQDLEALNMGGTVDYNSLKDPIGHGSLTNEKGTMIYLKGMKVEVFFGGKVPNGIQHQIINFSLN